MENNMNRFIQLGDTHIQDTKTGEEYYAPCEEDLIDLLNDLERRINAQSKTLEYMTKRHNALIKTIKDIKQDIGNGESHLEQIRINNKGGIFE